MKKDILAVVISVGVISGAIFLAGVTDNGSADLTGGPQGETEVNEEMSDLINCLAEEGVVIYGSEWCPFCADLVDNFGGYDIIDPIYVECTEEDQRCQEEMIGRGVPEIQVEGEVYEGSRSPSDVAEKFNCEL